jgi:zinc transport system permease protein
LILAGLIKFKQDLILCAIHEDLARSEGVSVNRLNMIFTFMMTIAIAISIQVIGLLLITSLLIIPPATSRLISKNPNQMIVFAIMFGFIAVVSGGMASIFLDLPTGPVMVVAASALFMLIVPFRQI